MTTSAKWSLVGVVVILVVLVALIPQLLSGSGTGDGDATGAAGDGVGEASTSTVADRPDCQDDGAAGVQLPCLGGEQGQGNDLPTVVNVWAWW